LRVFLDTNDADDAWVLASALACGSEVLVTGDKDLLDLQVDARIQILSPREFLSRMGQIS